jgi:hypothetical protein
MIFYGWVIKSCLFSANTTHLIYKSHSDLFKLVTPQWFTGVSTIWVTLFGAQVYCNCKGKWKVLDCVVMNHCLITSNILFSFYCWPSGKFIHFSTKVVLEFSLCHRFHIGSGKYPAPCPRVLWAISLRIKWLEHGADHSFHLWPSKNVVIVYAPFYHADKYLVWYLLHIVLDCISENKIQLNQPHYLYFQTFIFT